MRRRRLAVLVLAAGLIGAYFAFFAARPTPPLPVAVPARPSQPAAPAMAPNRASASAVDSIAVAPTPTRRIDITCREDDFPAVNLPDTSALTSQRTAMLAGQQFHQAVRVGLDADGDARSKALSLFLAAMDHSFDPAQCEGNDCGAPWQAQAQVAARAAEQLAALAHSARLPQPYAWALSACLRKAADPVLYPACANVSVQHWADAAPDNAWPWLLLALDAQNRNDPSGVESAMHRASIASDWWHPGDEARRIWVRHLPPSVSSNTVLHAMGGVGFLHADKDGGLSALSRYCGANQDANRAQTCARLAAGVLKSSNDLFQLSMALKIGARSGVPPDVLTLLESKRDTAQANMRSTVELMSPYRKCPFSQVQARVAIRAADVGEIAAIEEEFRARPR